MKYNTTHTITEVLERTRYVFSDNQPVYPNEVIDYIEAELQSIRDEGAFTISPPISPPNTPYTPNTTYPPINPHNTPYTPNAQYTTPPNAQYATYPRKEDDITETDAIFRSSSRSSSSSSRSSSRSTVGGKNPPTLL